MNSGITAMGTLAIIAGGLGALVWYANRAGRNAAQVSSAKAKTDAATDGARVFKAMGEAASRYISDDDLMNALKRGEA
ncbi:hypothetical protein CGLAMM_02910 [Acetobacteraceae bacterium EV16G]|uniref:Uncharacterized protein n=1 Tax=Sorlinia euscelidii TaxID=3081148 RepID=A0ABU7U3H1_9PROT